MADDPHQLRPLLSQSLAGDRRALSELLDRLRAYLKVLIRSWLGPELAGRQLDSDLVQDSLVRIHAGFGGFRGRGVPELLGWARTIARHVVCDRTRDPAAGKLEEQLPDPGPSPPQALADAEDAARLALALERLPTARRDVLLFRLIDRLSFDDISREMGRKAGALRVLFLRAVRQLRTILETNG